MPCEFTCPQVEALLDRGPDGRPAIQLLTDAFEKLGYRSWAHRVVCSAGVRAWAHSFFHLSIMRRQYILKNTLHAFHPIDNLYVTNRVSNEELLTTMHSVHSHPAQKAAATHAQGCFVWLAHATGFGLPNRRKRVFLVASIHGDARAVLLGQGSLRCLGACMFGKTPDGDARSEQTCCYECFVRRATVSW